MKLLTIIQHHPSRIRYLDLLLNALDKTVGDNDLQIVTNEISSASGMAQCFRTGVETDYTHFLILQDDILPSKDLIKTAKVLMGVLPNEIVSMFSAQPIIAKASRAKRNFVTIDRLYGLCAYIIPAFMAENYLENWSRNIKDDIRADDVRISIFLEGIKKRAWLTAPSLVEHIAWDRSTQQEERVKLDNALIYRVSADYIGFEKSGLEIDWQKSAKYPLHIDIGGQYDHIRHMKKL